MRKFYLSCLILLTVAACNPSKKTVDNASDIASEALSTEIVDPEHTAQTSLSYTGIYEGITPCADCEGIKVTVTLRGDSTYTLKNVYLKNGKEIEPSEYTGKYIWSTDGFQINLEGVENAPSRFWVGEGTLTILDKEGNKIDTTNLAEHYILKQIEMFD